MKNHFEFGSLLVWYSPLSGIYLVRDNLLGTYIGAVVCHEGPGWILDFDNSTLAFMSADQLRDLAQMVTDLNETLEEV